MVEEAKCTCDGHEHEGDEACTVEACSCTTAPVKDEDEHFVVS